MNAKLERKLHYMYKLRRRRRGAKGGSRGAREIRAAAANSLALLLAADNESLLYSIEVCESSEFLQHYDVARCVCKRRASFAIE